MSKCRSGRGQREEWSLSQQTHCSLILHLPSHLFGPPNIMLLLCKASQTVPVLAAGVLAFKQPPERCCRCCAGWQHHPSCLWGFASRGLVQVEPVLLATWGLRVPVIPAVPWAPMKATRVAHLTFSIVSHASQYGQFAIDIGLWISYHVVYI